MLVAAQHEYAALVQAIAASKACNEEQASAYLESALTDIEQGNTSYAGAAARLGLRVELSGRCGFDAADYLSMLI
jgi:hypothetical protein